MAHVLVIDDDLTIHTILAHLLDDLGHKAVYVTDGKKGMKCLNDQTFDLVITDIIMPEMDGFEVIRTLRSSAPETPVIALTGGSPSLGRDYLITLSKALKAHRVLSKPLDVRLLTTAIHELLAA